MGEPQAYDPARTAAEFRLFADFRHGLKQTVRVVLEAIGNYHRPLAPFLQTRGFHLEWIASHAVARTHHACITPGTSSNDVSGVSYQCRPQAHGLYRDSCQDGMRAQWDH